MSVLFEVDAERRASVALDIVTTSQIAFQRERRRPSALTAREALAAIQFEVHFVAVVAANLRHGEVLGDADWERLATSVRYCNAIADEVLS